eukprot:2452491-Heterocapsa_arctica.AAC.1
MEDSEITFRNDRHEGRRLPEPARRRIFDNQRLGRCAQASGLGGCPCGRVLRPCQISWGGPILRVAPLP